MTLFPNIPSRLPWQGIREGYGKIILPLVKKTSPNQKKGDGFCFSLDIALSLGIH